MTDYNRRVLKLLKRLQQLDPDTYIIFNGLRHMGWRMLPRKDGGTDFEAVTSNKLTLQDRYQLQGVLQDAIAGRGWGWDICTEWPRPFKFAAIIYFNEADADTGEYWDDSPAEALLWAYIAALEATR